MSNQIRKWNQHVFGFSMFWNQISGRIIPRMDKLQSAIAQEHQQQLTSIPRNSAGHQKEPWSREGWQMT
jgi:hypothetical protein